MELALRLLDGNIVNAGLATPHQPRIIELERGHG
jgi:hypothetical protein